VITFYQYENTQTITFYQYENTQTITFYRYENTQLHFTNMRIHKQLHFINMRIHKQLHFTHMSCKQSRVYRLPDGAACFLHALNDISSVSSIASSHDGLDLMLARA
jgi:hypothetical protein